MLDDIRRRIDRELSRAGSRLGASSCLAGAKPFLGPVDRLMRSEGKRIRPILFVLGYRGFSPRAPARLYETAISLELLHHFVLVHDDIIDRAERRRGVPSVHFSYGRLLSRRPDRRLAGEDLAIVVGDMLYAIALRSFLAIRVAPEKKLRALELLTRTAFRTGCGEFNELLHSLAPLRRVTRRDVYRIYDLKTAEYSFAAPLAIGAILAGAPDVEVGRLFRCGRYLGRAFQIKDDVLDLTDANGPPDDTKLVDLREGRKTLLVWFTYRHGSVAQRSRLQQAMRGRATGTRQLRRVARDIEQAGALRYARSEIRRLKRCAKRLLGDVAIRDRYRQTLLRYWDEILEVRDL